MFEKLKNLIKKPDPPKPEPKPKKPKAQKKTLSPKEQATKNREPWINATQINVNKNDPRNGFFELDWNEYFVVQLREAGYQGQSDEEVVDAWFRELCNTVAREDEKIVDMLSRPRVQSQRRDDGTTEYS